MFVLHCISSKDAKKANDNKKPTPRNNKYTDCYSTLKMSKHNQIIPYATREDALLTDNSFSIIYGNLSLSLLCLCHSTVTNWHSLPAISFKVMGEFEANFAIVHTAAGRLCWYSCS